MFTSKSGHRAASCLPVFDMDRYELMQGHCSMRQSQHTLRLAIHVCLLTLFIVEEIQCASELS